MPQGELAALAAAATWAVGSLLFAKIGKRVAPGAMNLGKCFAAAIVLSALRLALGPAIFGLSFDAVALLSLSGVVGLTIGDTAYFGAIVALGVPRAILLLSAAPVIAAFGGVLFFSEELGGREVAGVALTLVGIALVVAFRAAPPPKAGAEAQHVFQTGRGVLLGAVAALCQGSGSLLSRRAMRLGIDPLGAAAGRLIAGALGLLLLSWASGKARPWIADLRRDRSWIHVAGASLVGTVCGIWLSQIAIARCASTGVATTLLSTSPIFALPLAHVLGHERVTGRAIAGTAIAIVGVVLLSLRAT